MCRAAKRWKGVEDQAVAPEQRRCASRPAPNRASRRADEPAIERSPPASTPTVNSQGPERALGCCHRGVLAGGPDALCGLGGAHGWRPRLDAALAYSNIVFACAILMGSSPPPPPKNPCQRIARHRQHDRVGRLLRRGGSLWCRSNLSHLWLGRSAAGCRTAAGQAIVVY